jgi:hypothetical protein
LGGRSLYVCMGDWKLQASEVRVSDAISFGSRISYWSFRETEVLGMIFEEVLVHQIVCWTDHR